MIPGSATILGAKATPPKTLPLGPGISNGGTGYTVGDVLTVVGGTLVPGGHAATVTVVTAPGGVVGTVTTLNPGNYIVLPSFPASTTGGTGTGATILIIGTALGGVKTVVGSYTIHTFTANGTFTVLIAPLTVDYLIVGGGGGSRFGGGGAGGGGARVRG